MLHKLQYISQGQSGLEHLRHIQLALDAGCKWIQLRLKSHEKKEILDLAHKVKRLCETYKAVFIMNDHVDIARETDAHGVHLGLNDMPVNEARIILGTKKMIGGTANTLEDVLKRVHEKCDYVGLGPFRFTTTKEKLSPILGLEGYKKITEELRSRGIEIPVYAIGGIELGDIENIIGSGIHGIAISGLITNASEKKEIVLHIKNKLHVVA